MTKHTLKNAILLGGALLTMGACSNNLQPIEQVVPAARSASESAPVPTMHPTPKNTQELENKDFTKTRSSEKRKIPRDILDGTSWSLLMLPSGTVTYPSTIAFKDGSFSGKGPCNPYGGTYEMNPDIRGSIIMDNILITARVCDQKKEETLLVNGLDTTVKIGASGKNLMFIDENGRMLALFKNN